MVGVVPAWPPAGSRMTAATSPRSKATSTALMSLGGQITTCSSVAPGTPADMGTSYGGVTAAAAPAGPPRKWAARFPNPGPPPYARAGRHGRGAGPGPGQGEGPPPAPPPRPVDEP